ncbi:MAG: lytic transglycosylase domain-containing protein [Pseudomonadota bacterium]
MKSLLRPAAMGFAAVMTAAFAAATPAPPSVKPSQLHASKIVSTQDAALLREAIGAAREYDWTKVNALRRAARDEDVRDIILWLLVTSESEIASFDLLNTAISRLDDWPLSTTMKIRAEARIGDSALSHPQRIAWLRETGPISGAGKAALAYSHTAIGQSAEAAAAARDAWRNNTLEPDVERDILNKFGSALSLQDHIARADFLMWTRQHSAARRLKPRLDSSHRALVDARIALQARQRGVDARVEAVPSKLQNHPGLLFDRAKWRRRAGFKDAVSPLLVQINGADVPVVARDDLWKERRLAVRAELKNGDQRTAYRLSKPHGLSRGVEFAEAEWLAGWISLRHLNDPETAFNHFATLRSGVSTPISVSRAEYWIGRALDAQGAKLEAQGAYREGAKHKYSYYGQLAAEKIDDLAITFPISAAPTQVDRAAFAERRLVRVLKLLGESGDRSHFRRFAFHLDDRLKTTAEHDLLAELAAEYQTPDVGVRGGKSGVNNGLAPINAAYPLLDLPSASRQRVEDAFVMAISRQESELNPRAISYANAHGLMQLLPSTARSQARREGLPFRTSWLTDDPEYNIRLGSAHLGDLVRTFDGSYIMAAAAYNAGARRPRQWVVEYGDPRLGEIDAIDWVEYIPFSQTRNYVQRILENIQVYRARLGESDRISISRDLNRGRR